MIALAAAWDQRKQSYLHICPTLYSNNTIKLALVMDVLR